jgi:large subunit ribosomal protein L22
MKVSAKLKYLRIAPRKVRLVIEQIRGKKVTEAEGILNFMTKKGSLPVLKLLKQAVANAKNNFQLDPLNLFISKITADEGPKIKRWRARARGSAAGIQKKVSHITIWLDELEKKTKKAKRAKKAEEKTEEKAEVKEIEKKTEEAPRETKPVKAAPKFKSEKELPKPKAEKTIRRFFRRKAF